jgi:hypothetical protein
MHIRAGARGDDSLSIAARDPRDNPTLTLMLPYVHELGDLDLELDDVIAAAARRAADSPVSVERQRAGSGIVWRVRAYLDRTVEPPRLPADNKVIEQLRSAKGSLERAGLVPRIRAEPGV